MQIKLVHSEADGDPAEAAGVAVILTTLTAPQKGKPFKTLMQCVDITALLQKRVKALPLLR